MNSRDQLEFDVMSAASEYGIGAIMFRNAMAKSLGLNLTESLCLTMLGTRGSSTPTQLARFTGLTSGATTAMLDRLERRGFVRREPNPNDRRGVIVEIDDRYSEQALALVAGIQSDHRAVVSGYTDGELETIADFLTRFASNMRRQSDLIEGEEDKPGSK